MEELETQTELFRIQGLESADSREKMRDALDRLAGVASLAVGPNRLTVSYYPQLLSSEALQMEIARLGFSIEERPHRLGRLHRFFESLAAENERFFGGEKPNCCALNRRKAVR